MLTILVAVISFIVGAIFGTILMILCMVAGERDRNEDHR